jgi:site-specific DNA-cytosine methylase
LIKIFYPKSVIGTITTAFGAKNYSNHQELMEGSVVVYEVNTELVDLPIQTRIRRLTPQECERLQGFPDDWTSGQADCHRYKQMGNAVTVNVIEWIGKRL